MCVARSKMGGQSVPAFSSGSSQGSTSNSNAGLTPQAQRLRESLAGFFDQLYPPTAEGAGVAGLGDSGQFTAAAAAASGQQHRFTAPSASSTGSTSLPRAVDSCCTLLFPHFESSRKRLLPCGRRITGRPLCVQTVARDRHGGLRQRPARPVAIAVRNNSNLVWIDHERFFKPISGVQFSLPLECGLMNAMVADSNLPYLTGRHAEAAVCQIAGQIAVFSACIGGSRPAAR